MISDEDEIALANLIYYPEAGAAGGEAGKPVYRGLAEDHNLPPGMHL